MKRITMIFSMVLVAVLLLTGCPTDADVASTNLSKAADQFQIDRRIVFYNGITGEWILAIEGKCSIGNYDAVGEVSITCKTGDTTYLKHYLGRSDNVTYFAEQLESANVSAYRYKLIYKPLTIIPDIDIAK
jgi:predicted small secreted protein